jgi:two-component system, LytTR family, sensor kinase
MSQRFSISPLYLAAISISLWTLIALTITVQTSQAYSILGREVPFNLVFIRQWFVWGVWGLYTLGVFWIAGRFSLMEQRFGWLVHLFFSVVIAGVQMSLAILTQYVTLFAPIAELLQAANATFARGIFLVNLGIYWSVLSGYYAFAFYNRYRERELQTARLKSQLMESQFYALKAQLQPHFLFNILNAAVSLVRLQKTDDAAHALILLSRLLRDVLDSGKREWTTLGEELDFLRRYLDLEKIRFGDRLCIVYDVPPDMLGFEIPHLILQPLIENAIKHGVSKKRHAVTITIRAAIHADTTDTNTVETSNAVRISVSDNGSGLPEGWTMQTHIGIGLSLVSNRLNYLYGAQSRFSLSTEESGGVIAHLVIPSRKSSLKPDDVPTLI